MLRPVATVNLISFVPAGLLPVTDPDVATDTPLTAHDAPPL